jgi:DNA-binding LytR/AlgR family response regulator
MKKLIIHTNDFLHFVLYSDISYCKSDNCYTSIFLNNGQELVLCKSLKRVSEELDTELFVRVNQSYLINKNYIKLIDKKNKQIELIDKKRIPFTTTITVLIGLIGNI